MIQKDQHTEPEQNPANDAPVAKNRYWRFAREIIETVILVVLIFISVRTVVHSYQVDGSSMLPSLQSEERIFVNPNAYGELNSGDFIDWIPGVSELRWFTIVDWGEPERGDVIVLTPPEPGQQHPHIKRVIGLPGDHIRIEHEGAVFVNDVELDEPYTGDYPNLCHEWGTYAICDTVVPEGHVFVLGDHRDNSVDSRYFGTVPFEQITGKAWMVYWPPKEIETVDHAGYHELTP